MHDTGTPGDSIRRRLLVFLIPSLLLLVLAGGALTYLVALRVATSAYDRSLLDPALDMAQNVRIGADGPRLDMPIQAQEALLYDHADAMIFQIRDAGDRVIAGTRELAPSPPLKVGEPGFYDGLYRNEPVRIAAVRSDSGIYVQVGETLHKRQRLIWEILAAELVPTLLIAFAAIGLAWSGVKHGIAPLARIRDELLRRGPLDLHPLTETNAPLEIAPALKAFNNLLQKIREGTAVQQRFLANAAHQLRTPLAGLQMHLELLLRRDLDAEVRAEVDAMHVATLRASHLATQLLSLARAEAGDSDGQHARRIVDLRHVADAAVQQWVPRAIARNVDLGFILDDAPVDANPLLMAELLNNLIDNAIRYTPPGGAVTVRSGVDGDRAFLSVEDNGPGIPAHARSRVLERFYRVEGTPGEGAGLGLAIVKEVVDRHGGALSLQFAGATGTRVIARFRALGTEPARAASA